MISDHRALNEYQRDVSQFVSLAVNVAIAMGTLQQRAEERMDRIDFEEPGDFGFVYLVGDGARYVKIGKSNNPINRLKSLRTGCPNLQLLALEATNNNRRLEAELHKRFKSSRIAGTEWFESSVARRWHAALRKYHPLNAAYIASLATRTN